MPSRLSSLLVRDGLVGVKRMEHAFQRQVIYGGCLDTILLEMNLVPEERLVQYLSLATGLPPATRSETNVFDADAIKTCSVELAKAYRVVPLCFEEGALRVLVHDPVDLTLLEELANEIEVPVQPLVVPEYRFHLVFSRMFGGTPHARFLALAKRAEEVTPSSPVGKARSVIIEDTGMDGEEETTEHVVVDVRDPRPTSVRTEEMATAALARRATRSELDATAAADAGDEERTRVEDDEERTRVDLGRKSGRHMAMTQVDEDALDAARTDPLPAVSPPELPSAPELQMRERRRGATVIGIGAAGSASSERITPPMGFRRATTNRPVTPAPGRSSTTPGTGYGEPAGEARDRGASEPMSEARAHSSSGPMDEAREGTSSEPILLQTRARSSSGPMGEAPRGRSDSEPAASARGRSGSEAMMEARVRSGSEPMGEARVRSGSEPAAGVRGGVISAAPLRVAEARALLETADDRDVIFGLLLRAIRSHAWYAGLLTVQGGAAIGRIAIAGNQIDHEQSATVLIPLDEPSAFHHVVSTASPHIGPIATGSPAVDGMIRRMGDELPPTALLLPIVLRNRVVAIAVGHSRSEPLDVGAMSEMLPLAAVAAEAVSRAIVKSKAGGRRPARVTPVEVPSAGRSGRSATGGGAGRARAQAPEPEPLPAPPRSAPEPGEIDLSKAESRPEIAISMEADEPEPIVRVLDAMDSDDPEVAEESRSEALRRVREVLAAAAERFPGNLRVDRYALGGRIISADKHGSLLALLVQIGSPAVPLLAAKMRDARRDIRYYATLCMAELRTAEAVDALIERIFDTDYGIRDTAVEALARYPLDELDRGLVFVRHALHSEEPERIHAAAVAVAALADVRAIPDLLDAHARGDKGSEHARQALLQLTKQDFGSSTRKWRAWWAEHKRQNRIEWLIDSLAHKDEVIRRSALEELRKVTGEHFGYQADGSKRDREQARQKWSEWWHTVGRQRFVRAAE